MPIFKTNNLNDPPLAPYMERSENRLYHWNEPAPGLFIAESMKVIERALAAGYEPVSVLCEEKYLSSLPAAMNSVPVYTAERSVMEQITGYALTGGILSAMRREPLPGLEKVLDLSDVTGDGAPADPHPLSRIALLDHVTNPTNVGAIVRCAAAMGLGAVIFTGGCADPLARRAVRVSMGCIFQIPWTVTTSPEETLERLKEAGYASCAMALTDRSVSIEDKKLRAEERLAIVLGNEGDGLPEETIALCDYTVRIPMHHGVDSLNVASAAAIAFWELG